MNKIQHYPELSDTAMVLAAGYGVRMRPLTLECPKPLLEVGNRTMLDWALDKAVSFGIRRAIVNAHYLAHKIETHLKGRQDLQLIISHEENLLDTGGGIKKILPFFSDKPFFVLSGDLPFIDESSCQTALVRMAQAWNPEQMDALLLLMPKEKTFGFSGKGDFHLAADGRLLRKDKILELTHVFISVILIKPELYAKIDSHVFSNNELFNFCEDRGTLYGIEHKGTCFHVGTPPDLEKANDLLSTGQGWRV